MNNVTREDLEDEEVTDHCEEHDNPGVLDPPLNNSGVIKYKVLKRISLLVED